MTKIAQTQWFSQNTALQNERRCPLENPPFFSASGHDNYLAYTMRAYCHAGASFLAWTHSFSEDQDFAKEIWSGVECYSSGETEMTHDTDRGTETHSRIIQELGALSASSGEYITIKMERWHYYIDRAKITMVEGIYKDEEFEEILDKCHRADAYARAGRPLPADCPRHFTLVCRPLDLVFLAKDILNLYKGYEDVHYVYTGQNDHQENYHQ